MSLKSGTSPFLPQTNPPTTPTKPQCTASFPSSSLFDDLSTALSTPSTHRAALAKGGKSIFGITLKNGSKEEASWHIDLSSEAGAGAERNCVGRGLAPEGKKPAVTLVMADSDFEALVKGKANAQRLFMSGKLKVKGDVMKAQKLEGLFKLVKGPAAKL